MFLCVFSKNFLFRLFSIASPKQAQTSLNLLYDKRLDVFIALASPEIWHITVRNIELFFGFCKLRNFSALKFFGIYNRFTTFALRS